ncbi:MAG: S-methyl-5-thioribose-1-phosphate isomerase [Candidatus Hydrothermota bacterium]|uniref:Methylthioribose-1-phosphate isomerase n=1 Tax=candidate division WOR-3 bacterium TaxID=2052148 RepID=A0A7C0X9M0_UNCW3|nr:MAG: S-methyl-5-thioribose-1-phosphate isomerase [Candidatus Hydrothermae bacterium]RKZ00900.1 MAG: S-methyl-5-thioribose-1-phosphate isomerase [Candidatus Hydrothermae bacterium]HDM90481.1 S-methyl-5-thioribose-1-phosphate isomerase [candidate division WOR-3 bacterium]
MKVIPEPVYLEGKAIYVLDQRRLPHEEVYLEIRDIDGLCGAIKSLSVRGAPLIAIAALYGLLLEIMKGTSREGLLTAIDKLASTRPTAFNLFRALGEVRRAIEGGAGEEDIRRLIEHLIECEKKSTHRIAANGVEEIKGGNALTICNTGVLATGGIGTALGIIFELAERGRIGTVYVSETRPLLQGARLTAWELLKAGVPHRLITDNTAAYLMSLGRVDFVVIGADRITLSGDTANKIGSLSLAISARYYGIPFYVAAPVTTVDGGLRSGDEIPIEERDEKEVLEVLGRRIAPQGTGALNFAFDVVPSELITAIITDKGIARPPYRESIGRLLSLSDTELGENAG